MQAEMGEFGSGVPASQGSSRGNWNAALVAFLYKSQTCDEGCGHANTSGLRWAKFTEAAWENVAQQSKKKKQRFFKQEVEDIDDEYTDEPSEEMLEMREPPVTASMASGSARSPNLLDGAVTPGELQEVCLRLERLEENLAISRRLERLEARLDDAAQQREAQHQTNALLSQVLSEISRLSRTLTNRFSSQATVQESTDLGSGITIVVPHSQHLE